MLRRIIIDTNLLLLLVIGAVENGKHIKNSKRLKAFKERDYQNILKIISHYDEIYITPYIATEISNLIDLKGDAKLLAYKFAQELFSTQCKKIDIDINKDCGSEFFLTHGITDSSLIRLAPDYFILTSDHRMLTPLYESSPDTIIPYVIC